MQYDPPPHDEPFEEQDEELVEIDELGNVYRLGVEPPRRSSKRKPTVLRDPEGEY